MSNVVNVETWEECYARIQAIRLEHHTKASTLLFRGQACSEWKLDTTLERRSSQTFNFIDYYKLALRIRPEIESESGLRWDVPSPEEMFAWAREYDPFKHYDVLAYEYLAHLRHNGFPSPLLDWSRSPQVAAYFAFSGAKSSHVAIYVYLERPNGIKGSGNGHPAIRTLGPYIRTHRRHFRQQAAYTVCANFLIEKFDNAHAWRFVNHESVFSSVQPTQQDLLWKIVIPAHERAKVLASLDEANLNAYSLFGSEESLMETLAYRELDVKPLAALQ